MDSSSRGGFAPLEAVERRVEASRGNAIALLADLLHLGEAVLKTWAAAAVAAVGDDKERHRYSLCHRVIRAAGIGDWDSAMADAVAGPASQHLLPGASQLRAELAERFGRGQWAHESAALLHGCLARVAAAPLERLPSQVLGRAWFTIFVQLRNKTRGHGAVTEGQATALNRDLEESLRILCGGSCVPRLAWAYLRQNMSGKYNVRQLGPQSSQRLRDLASDKRSQPLPEGLYLDLGSLARVELVETDPDLTDFFYPNGNFRNKRSEWLSYASGERQDRDATAYLAPATALPASSTEGSSALDVVNRCLANLPPAPADYVRRGGLEGELRSTLLSERHEVVTLVGRGGIGKTSLALGVLHGLTREDRFFGIVWLSARDIDLTQGGARVVRPAVTTTKDLARAVSGLFQPAGWSESGFDHVAYLARVLEKPEDGALLLAFDNFETVRDPLDVYEWLGTYVRHPNKVLITTRHRDFKGGLRCRGWRDGADRMRRVGLQDGEGDRSRGACDARVPPGDIRGVRGPPLCRQNPCRRGCGKGRGARCSRRPGDGGEGRPSGRSV